MVANIESLSPLSQLDSPNGRLIAEWVMNNHAALNVKYIIWTQKIWNSNEAPKSWTNWRGMEDRGDPTANHRYVFI